FRRYIWNRSDNGDELQMLVMTQRVGSLPDLWHIVDGAAIWVADGERSIGVGSYLADYLSDKLQSFRHDEAEAIAAAAYILKEVKDHIDGVGLDSTVYLFRRDGSVEHFFQDTLTKLEPIFSQFNELVSHVFNAAFNLDYPITDDEIERERHQLRGDYMAAVEEIKDEAQRMGYTSTPFRR